MIAVITGTGGYPTQPGDRGNAAQSAAVLRRDSASRVATTSDRVLQWCSQLRPCIRQYLDQVPVIDLRRDGGLLVAHREFDDALPVQDGGGHHPTCGPLPEENFLTP
jgi:hypothetical protein